MCVCLNVIHKERVIFTVTCIYVFRERDIDIYIYMYLTLCIHVYMPCYT